MVGLEYLRRDELISMDRVPGMEEAAAANAKVQIFLVSLRFDAYIILIGTYMIPMPCVLHRFDNYGVGLAKISSTYHD
jgi:hypothetical protein